MPWSRLFVRRVVLLRLVWQHPLYRRLRQRQLPGHYLAWGPPLPQW